MLKQTLIDQTESLCRLITAIRFNGNLEPLNASFAACRCRIETALPSGRSKDIADAFDGFESLCLAASVQTGNAGFTKLAFHAATLQTAFLAMSTSGKAKRKGSGHA